VGKYYLKNKRIPQAQYIFGRYLTYYPSGKNAAQAAKNLQFIRGEKGAGPVAGAPPEAMTELPLTTAALNRRSSIGRTLKENDSGKAYHDAVDLIAQGNFQQAFVALQAIIDANEDLEYVVKSSHEIGRCLFMMNKFEECIQHFTKMITNYPKHPNLGDALFLMAQSHENQGKKEMAEVFYKMILTKIPSEDAPVNIKAKKALAALGNA
ncbi:MAG: tetratricopeptide repeat protein, partial [Treponema sp.]|jgi:TolA-binding protein|nr:tetratricopeptide repeat protein [Treponema sp.]